MRRSVPHVKHRKSKTPGSQFYLEVTEGGKRARKYFATRSAANAACRAVKDKLHREGHKALSISDATRIAAVEAEKALSKYEGATIAKAVEFYIDHLEAKNKSIPIRQLIAECMAAKEQDKELSREHIDDLRNRYDRFCEHFGASGTRTLTSKEVQEWLWSLPLTAQSKNNFRARLFALFNFAVAREYMEKNLCAAIKPLKIRKAKKEIFTPDELRAVLDHASPEILPAIVIGAFAGVRTKERTLLTWEDIDIKRGKLTVGAEDSKTAARRTIAMEECLKAWLAPFNGHSGPIFDGTDMRFCQKLSKICKAAGLKKAPKNGLRHSFASYHVAKYQDAERVRGDLGHTTANLLFANYREMVQPEDAERWFNIFPPQPAENVVPIAAA